MSSQQAAPEQALPQEQAKKSSGEPSPSHADKLTSDAFGVENPPKDWADMAFLVPHECIRRQMAMMVQSANALPEELKQDELWKATLFAKWYTEFFFGIVEEHHDAEENTFFPWIQTRAEVNEKQFSKDHEELIAMMNDLHAICETILKRGGKGCGKEIADLKSKIPAFEKDMRAHLKEEEETFPGLLREHFTEEEMDAKIDEMLKEGGVTLMKKFLPAVLAAMQEWCTDEYVNNFLKTLPPPVKYLALKYYIPDFENVTCQMRDAPTLAKKPSLKRKGCFGIPFCFPCIL